MKKKNYQRGFLKNKEPPTEGDGREKEMQHQTLGMRSGKALA
jgi:hypothetical protein